MIPQPLIINWCNVYYSGKGSITWSVSRGLPDIRGHALDLMSQAPLLSEACFKIQHIFNDNIVFLSLGYRFTISTVSSRGVMRNHTSYGQESAIQKSLQIGCKCNLK